MDGSHAPARSFHHVAIAERVIGVEVVIAAFLGDATHAGAILGAAGAMGAEAVGGGACRLLQRRRGR